MSFDQIFLAISYKYITYGLMQSTLSVSSLCTRAHHTPKYIISDFIKRVRANILSDAVCDVTMWSKSDSFGMHGVMCA